MKNKLVRFISVLFCSAFILGLSSCTALFEKNDTYPEMDPVVTGGDKPVVSPDDTDKTIYISDGNVLSAQINEEGKLVVTPIRPGKSEVSFYNTENKTFVTKEFEVTDKGELVENPVLKVAGYEDVSASVFWFDKITDVKVGYSDIIEAKIIQNGTAVRLISKIIEGEGGLVSKLEISGLIEKSTNFSKLGDAYKANGKSRSRNDSDSNTIEDKLTVFAAVDFDSVTDSCVKIRAPVVLPFTKYSIDDIALKSFDKTTINNNTDFEVIEVNKNNEIIISAHAYGEEEAVDLVLVPESDYVYVVIKRTIQTKTLPFEVNSEINKFVLPVIDSSDTESELKKELDGFDSKSVEVSSTNENCVVPMFYDGSLFLHPGYSEGKSMVEVTDGNGKSYSFFTETKKDTTKTPPVMTVIPFETYTITSEKFEEDFGFPLSDLSSGKAKIDVQNADEDNPSIDTPAVSEDALVLKAMHAGAANIIITDENDNDYCLGLVVANDGTISSTFTVTDYAITVENTSHGTVTATPNRAVAGETITISVTPDDGYQVKTYSVTSGGKTVPVTDNTFTMPKEDVTVSITFEQAPAVGDVLLNDGTIIQYANIGIMTEELKSKAVGVLYALDDEGKPMGWLGLYNSAGEENSGKYKWSKLNTNVNGTKFTDIECKSVDNAPQGTVPYTGTTDGSDNWSYICNQDSSGTANAATNYPAFNYVNKYAETYNLTGTYASGWYMPSIAELWYINSNKTRINSVLDELGGVAFNDHYWSSSQFGDDDRNYIWFIYSTGVITFGSKTDTYRVCCIRKFTESE